MSATVATQFALKLVEAKSGATEVAGVVRGWRAEARKHGLTGAECDQMASAFEPSA
jgi:hypothetical protein